MGGKPLPFKYAVPQIIAACIAHSIAIQAGINLAFSAVLLPQLMVDDNDTDTSALNHTKELTVNKNEASWIASLVTITTPIGSLITGALMDQFGRKTICALTCLPFALSWTLTFFSTNVYMLYAARTLAGMAGGLSTAAIVYVSEISHPTLRPMLLSLTSVFVSFGILITNIMGNYFYWKIIAVCCGILAVFKFILLLFIPETPSWLAGFHVHKDDSNSRMYLAQKSVKWLYRKNEISEIQMVEIDNIRSSISASKNEKLVEKGGEEALSTKFSSPKTWKPMALLIAIFTFQQLTGGYIIIFYAVQIFKEVGGIELDEFTSVIVLGAVRFVMAIISMFLSKTIGRRVLLITSAAGMSTSILAGALYLYFFGDGIGPVILLLLFVLFSSYGVLVVPWSLIGELLPLHIRGKGSGFIIAIVYLKMFITVKSFITVLDIIGIINVFIIFGSVAAALALFVYFKLPETLGKSFHEVEKNF